MRSRNIPTPTRGSIRTAKPVNQPNHSTSFQNTSTLVKARKIASCIYHSGHSKQPSCWLLVILLATDTFSRLSKDKSNTTQAINNSILSGKRNSYTWQEHILTHWNIDGYVGPCRDCEQSGEKRTYIQSSIPTFLVINCFTLLFIIWGSQDRSGTLFLVDRPRL